MSEKVLVGGVGMIPFSKPGASPSYTDMGAEAVRRALADCFDVPVSYVRVVSGHKFRQKVIEII